MPPSVRSVGNSSASAALSRSAKADSRCTRSESSLRAPPGVARSSSRIAGRVTKVSRIPPNSRGLRRRFCRRESILGISRTAISDSPIRAELPGCLTKAATASERWRIIARSVDGSASQRASNRAPAGVKVRSSVSINEPSRRPDCVAKSSRLRDDAGSSRTDCPKRTSVKRVRLRGRSQSESVTYPKTAPAAPSAGWVSSRPKPARLWTASVCPTSRAPALMSKFQPGVRETERPASNCPKSSLCASGTSRPSGKMTSLGDSACK